MREIPHSIDVTFARALASLAAAAIALGCGAEPPGPSRSAAPPNAAAGSGAAVASDLTYQSLLALLGEPDEFARARKLAELLPNAGPESLPVVKEVLEQTHQSWIELGASDFELLMRYWALHDPAGAAHYAFGSSPRAYRVAAIHATLRPWASADPREALDRAWLWARERGVAGAAVQIALVRGWYESEQPGLEEYIRDLGASFDRQRALAAYATAVVRKRGADALVRWAKAVPADDANYKLDVFRSAGSVLVAFDLDAAKRFCDAHCDGPHGASLRNRIATRWAELGGGQAPLEWLKAAPENDETSFAIRRTYAVWAEKEREAALQWVNAALAGEMPAWVRPALPIYVRMLGRDSPTDGLDAVARYFEGREREELEIEIARHWRQQDEAAAEAWLRRSSLSAEALDKVRAPQRRIERMQLEEEAYRRRLRSSKASG